MSSKDLVGKELASDAVVHVIEDDDAMRDSLSFLLGTAGIPVHTYDSALAFLSSPNAVRKGCIVTDVRMPGMSGIELLQRLRAEGSLLPVIVITGHGDVAMAVAAMKVGAADFFEKPFDDEKFLESVRNQLKGTLQTGAREAAKATILDRLASLSTRERQVLDGLVAGLPNKTIAYDLGISSRTVEVYRANLMTKMQAGSLSELVRMALTVGLSEPAEKDNGGMRE